ncbi:hypothetical protein AMATHDRAFT_88580 [Amanita thiersii Skay4041]|uniref:Uncharacterized protein n=1 Tax=Amanita thiersii Skay4041 TaxID=703135 RepID=A0A2A9N7E2_9AGAR|nr:hypothetical protein AMATHDRAFT_88580 [Amanita thiersii Skay4041]
MPLISVLTANAGISGAALLITALIETGKHRLSLFHAIFIIHSLFFLGINISPIGKYKGNVSVRLVLTIFLGLGLMLTYLGWSLFVWATTSTFGPSPECNSQIKYIMFFAVKISATAGWLSRFWLALLSITLIAMFFTPLLACCCPTRNRFVLPTTYTAQAGHLLAPVYGIANLELYVKANKHLLTDGEQTLSFGQIYALVMVISIADELLHYVLAGCGDDDDDD